MNYVNAKSAQDALRALLTGGGDACIIAGGSDMMVELQEGKRSVKTLVDITGATDMKDLAVRDGQLIIGAAVTLTEIARSTLVKQYFPSLCKGAGSVGSLQIRNSATLAGNVITAQPAADGAVALSPLEPRFVVLSAEGERLVTLPDMYAGFGKSALDSTRELVREIRIPLPERDEAAAFIRLELRKSLSLPMLNVAAMVKYAGGAVKWARIGMGPVGVGPVRAKQAEAYLVGKSLCGDTMSEAGHLALADANPRSNPLRGSKEYRTDALPVLVRRALEDVAAQLAAR